MTNWLRPLPTITEHSAPFYAGLRQRKFLVPRCRACGDFNWTPYPACRSCLSEEHDWIEVSGRGDLYSYSTVYVGPKSFGRDGPYTVAVVKLLEQPRTMIVMGNLVGCAIEDIRIDMPLRVCYLDVPGHDVTLYQFEPDR
jgi:uncharacterized OB-fold protein